MTLAENRFRFLNGAKLKKVPSKINNGIEVCHRLLRNPYRTLKEHVKERDEIGKVNLKSIYLFYAWPAVLS